MINGALKENKQQIKIQGGKSPLSRKSNKTKKAREKNKSRMKVKFSCDAGMSAIDRCTEKETDLRRRKGNKR